MFGQKDTAIREKADQTSAIPRPDREDVVLGLSPAGFHEIAYVEWGPVDDPCPILCVHGLTRQARDFDYLAKALAATGRRVICPDLPGRGRSGRISNPNFYALPQYCSDMNALIARLRLRELEWVGTSLGGLIGIVMAGFPGTMVRKLVINDIGPYITMSGLQRIGQYASRMPTSFPTLEDAESYFRNVLEPYGSLSDEHWRHLTIHSIRWNDKFKHYTMLCDPGIAKALKTPWVYPSLNLWKYWEAITAPMLVLRGVYSDILSHDLTLEMRRRNRLANIFQFDGCGHVPPLMTPEQINVVTKFLKTEPGKTQGQFG